MKLWMMNKPSKPILNPTQSMPLIAKEPKSQSIPRMISNPLSKPAPSSPSIIEKGIIVLITMLYRVNDGKER